MDFKYVETCFALMFCRRSVPFTATILVLSLLAYLRGTRAQTESLETFEKVDSLLKDPDKYDRKVRPQLTTTGLPTLVKASMHINSISEVDALRMDYKMSLELRQYWMDPRLAHNQADPDHKVILNAQHQYEDLWVPDLIFLNEKDGLHHDITTPNRMIWIYGNGSILYTQRLAMVLSCQFYLQKFPLDNQTCGIRMSSYAYPVSEILLTWHEIPVTIQYESLLLPEFTITNVKPLLCQDVTMTGRYPCLQLHIMFDRQWSYYIIQTFMPTYLIVIISWLSFWIDKGAVPARTTLGIMTVLTITTQSANINERLPRVSYIKAIDIYMATSMFFVFAALIEFSFVNVFDRSKKLHMKKLLRPTISQQFSIDEPVPRTPSTLSENPENALSIGGGIKEMMTECISPTKDDLITKQSPKSWLRSQCSHFYRKYLHVFMTRDPARNIDMISRVLFPLLYLIFNCLYFMGIHLVTYPHVNHVIV